MVFQVTKTAWDVFKVWHKHTFQIPFSHLLKNPTENKLQKLKRIEDIKYTKKKWTKKKRSLEYYWVKDDLKNKLCNDYGPPLS